MELHQERFEAWLFSQPKDRTIKATDPWNCVLCTFLRETTNLKPVFSWSKWGCHGEGELFYDIPQWAKLLINKMWVIECYGYTGRLDVSCGTLQNRYTKLFGRKETIPVQQTQTASEPQIFLCEAI